MNIPENHRPPIFFKKKSAVVPIAIDVVSLALAAVVVVLAMWVA